MHVIVYVDHVGLAAHDEAPLHVGHVDEAVVDRRGGQRFPAK